MEDKVETSSALPESSQPVCPKCLSVISGYEHFCDNCGVALSILSPFDHIRAMGNAYRSGSNEPRKPIVLIGIWVISFPPLLFFVGVGLYAVTHISDVIAEFHNPRGVDPVQWIFALCLYSGLTFIAARILYKTTKNFFRLRNNSR
jgi:hypothetical protein